MTSQNPIVVHHRGAPSGPNGPSGPPPSLPVPPDEPDPEPNESVTPLVVLRGLHKKPLVLGEEVELLNYAQYDVIQALLDAGPGGLTMDELDESSGRPEARKILKRLHDSDPRWARVIRMAGKRCCCYRLGLE